MLIATLLLNGLMTGLQYALMALGLSLVFGVFRLVNFAHGEFFMVGAYAYTLGATLLHIPPALALPLALVVGAALGALTERLLIRPLYAAHSASRLPRDEYAVVVTFGLSVLLVNLANELIGPFAYRGPAFAPTATFRLGGMVLNEGRLVVSGLALATLGATVLALHRTPWGRRIRAVSQNRFGAALAGIDADRASLGVFALSGALAALSGALLSPFINPTPDVGSFPGVKSYIIVVLGGLGSVPGSLLASLLLGVVESLGAVYVSYAYRDAFGLVLLMLFLVFRPQGFFGERVREL